MENGKIVIYQTADGQTTVDVALDHDTVWLTQAQIVELFGSSKANISEHIKSIFSSAELEENATVRKFRTVRQEMKMTNHLKALLRQFPNLLAKQIFIQKLSLR